MHCKQSIIKGNRYMLFARNYSNNICLLYGTYFEMVAYINVQWKYIMKIESEKTHNNSTVHVI